MKTCIFGICWLLVGMTTLLAVPVDDLKTWKRHRVVIPHFFFEYKTPPSLVRGYGPQRDEITFGEPKRDDAMSPFGPGAYQKNIVILYYGLVGEFRDWDLTVSVFVVNFSRENPMKSADALSDYVQAVFIQKDVLKNGKEVSDFGGVSKISIAATDVVVSTAKDMEHITPIELKNGGLTSHMPYRIYFIRLDDEIAVGLRVLHYNKKKLGPKWHAEAQAMAISILETMKFTPRP